MVSKHQSSCKIRSPSILYYPASKKEVVSFPYRITFKFHFPYLLRLKLIKGYLRDFRLSQGFWL